MTDLVWVINREKDASFGSTGVSGSYILPKNESDLNPKALASRRLWVVMRGYEDRLLLIIKIKKVETIIDGLYYGDYLISAEMTRSLKLASDYVHATRYATTFTRHSRLGVSELSHEYSDALLAFVEGSIQTRLLPPDKLSLAQIDFQLVPKNSRRLAQSALRAVVSHLPLEQVWANGTGDRLGAFSNYARALLLEKMGENLPLNIAHDLKLFDPLSLIFGVQKRTTDEQETFSNYRAPNVDAELCEIVPENIYAREYVSDVLEVRSIDEALYKTEKAEAIHQAILKDISEYLIANGITPYESSSIDLLFCAKGLVNIIEIKSSNGNNILSQASKGAFQLACYLNEIKKDYDNLSACLVLQVVQSSELQMYVAEALSTLGIKVFFYDPSLSWPSRIKGFPL
jgi:hypothetical protein